ncbi:MAG TPA: hypothetical protein VEB22_04970 [Phycisphaerales bacterium]|nr:hypothetical protein [Phycisphaerales bacterium]
MNRRKLILTTIAGAALLLSPAAMADHGGNSGNGSGHGSGGGGNSGGASNAATVRNAQRALRDAADAAERVVKQEKDSRVRIIFGLRAAGATADEVNAALADGLAAVTAATGSGIAQVNALKAALLASLPPTATAGHRAAIESAAAAGIGKLNKRLRSATQDLNRATRARIPAGTLPHHPFPEHGPNHP